MGDLFSKELEPPSGFGVTACYYIITTRVQKRGIEFSGFTHWDFLFTDKNQISFIPRENGVHSINVRFNGSHIPGSPFNVRVGEPDQAADPGRVSAFGPGLQGGCTGTVHIPQPLLFPLIHWYENLFRV